MFFIIIAFVFSDVLCNESSQVKKHVSILDSRIEDFSTVFGTFLSDKPSMEASTDKTSKKNSNGRITVEAFQVTPKALSDLPQDFQFSADELAFHQLLHQGGKESLFSKFINDVKMAGARHFLPHKMENQLNALLRNQIGLLKNAATLPDDVIIEEETDQDELMPSLKTVLKYANDLQRINNKTYCIAGVNFVFSTAETPQIMKECFITLPYVFISDGMDQGIIASMEKFFSKRNVYDENPYLKNIKNVDYYARDLLDTEDTILRVRKKSTVCTSTSYNRCNYYRNKSTNAIVTNSKVCSC